MKQMKKWASVLVAFFLLASLSIPSTMAAGTVYRETTADFNLRSGPGSTYPVVSDGYVPKGDVVVVTSTWYAEWWKVKHTSAGGKMTEGYIKSGYLKETSKRKNEKKNTAALGCYSTILELNFRAGPGTSYEAITAVPEGNLVNVTDTSNEEWYKCTYISSKGKQYTGYLSAKYLRKAPEPYNVKSKTQLRKSPSTSSRNLKTLPKGSYLYVTAVYNSKWFQVEYTDIDGNRMSGYVLRNKVKKGTVTNKAYKQVDPDAETKQISELWRTRDRWQLTKKTKLTKTASSKGTKVATLSKGTVVAVVGSSGKYDKVIWNNGDNQKKVGYLPKSKLKKYTDLNGGDYVALVKTPLRGSDNETGEVLMKLKATAVFTVLDTTEEDWYWVSCADENGNSIFGFVYKDHAQKYEEKNAGNYCITVKTRLRKTASDTGKVLKDLPQGGLVDVKKTSNPDWYYASYTQADGESVEGYVSSAHLRRFESRNMSYVAVAKTKLRIQPDDCAKVTKQVQQGQRVTVNDIPVDDWYWASVVDEEGNEHVGYVYAPHLKEYEEEQKQEEKQENPQEKQQESPENQQNPVNEEKPGPANPTTQAAEDDPDGEKADEPEEENDPVEEDTLAEGGTTEAEELFDVVLELPASSEEAA